MDVAYARKQVVLNLKTQFPHIPRDPGAVRHKMRCRLYLMCGPFLRHHAGVCIRGGEAGGPDCMDELKYHQERLAWPRAGCDPASRQRKLAQ